MSVSAPVWTTSCPDWERRIVARESLLPLGPLFGDQADRALEVFCSLRVADVPGTPTMGEIARPWLLQFVAVLFGAYDAEAGRRLITEALLLISKKNSKSTLAGLLWLTALILNWREQAELTILAPTIEVANNSFTPAAGAIRLDEELSDLLHVQPHTRTITHRTTRAELKVVAAEAATVAGKKSGFTLIDELWLFGERADAAAMLMEAVGGMASRPEGLLLYLSTMADREPAGVFREKLLYARGVRDGKIIDPQFLPLIYEFPKAMLDCKAYLDPVNAYITNPNMGASVDEAFIRRQMEIQRAAGEDKFRIFLAKHMNVEIGQRLHSNGWSGAEFWERQATAGLDLHTVIDRSDVITAGIDGGGLDDLLSVTVIGRDARTGDWLHWTRSWAHQIALKRNAAQAPRMLDFARAGELTIVEHIGDDVRDVAELAAQLEASGKLNRIGCDPAGIGAIVDAIVAADVPQDKVVGISQGWRLSGAINTLARKVAEGRLHHGGSGLMAYAVGNAIVEPRGNAILVTKATAGQAKIDPLLASFNAVELMSRAPQTAQDPQMFSLG